jgi:hypothetical protein
MIRKSTAVFPRLGVALTLIWAFVVTCAAAGPLPAKAAKASPVWVVFFSSRNCPRCQDVKQLLKGLKSAYPLRVKVFDVEREKDYALLQSLEAIHSKDKFVIPLIIIGESILMGEDEIVGNLEKTVRKLSRCGGAALPYLGEKKRQARERIPRTKIQAEAASSRCPCADEGRPPSLGDEWKKIRALLDRYF